MSPLLPCPIAMTTALLIDDVYRDHRTGEGHPERPERHDALVRAFAEPGLASTLKRVQPRAATAVELALVHDPAYLRLAESEISGGVRQLSTGDTAVGPGSWNVALRAAGGVLNAVDEVCTRAARNAFCAVRPPGHHATPNRGMGFCILNNVAIAARYAQKRHGIRSVLIADWDVHHGNGTQDTFYRDGTVLFFSTHQSPWYPGTGAASETGEGAGKGTTINCPFAAGAGAQEIAGAFRNRLIPAAERFKPELVILSAGFDSRAGDPLGRFTLSDDDFVTLTEIALEIADKHAGGRLLSVLEGGYSLSGLASAAQAHVKTLLR